MDNLPGLAGMSIEFEIYSGESQLPSIHKLIGENLSEAYSIYVYRYFIHQWPQLCFVAKDVNKIVGVIICKLEIHRHGPLRGYIAMLAIWQEYRGRGLATRLVLLAIEAMRRQNADEISLETEVANGAAIRLYEKLGFIRYKRLHCYYLNANDAFRLLLPLRNLSFRALNYQ